MKVWTVVVRGDSDPRVSGDVTRTVPTPSPSFFLRVIMVFTKKLSKSVYKLPNLKFLL
jgi:hypothetical protein